MLKMDTMNTMRWFRAVSLAMFALLFTGCVETVDIGDQFHETSKLVLYCRLCPQMDTTYIQLANSEVLYSHQNSSITNLANGTVELSDDGLRWVPAIYSPEKERFVITRQEFPVQEGHTYYIRASYPGYEDVSSSCTVPVTRDVAFRFDTVSAVNDIHWGEMYNWPHKDVYMQWRDVPGEQNFYALFLYHQINHIFIDDQGNMHESTSWQYDMGWFYEGNTELMCVSDQGHEGGEMRYLFEEDVEDDWDDWDDWDGKPATEQYYLMFLDRNCYLYETTLTSENELNFLMLEPPHTYTNIDNGFGLFGAYSLLPVP